LIARPGNIIHGIVSNDPSPLWWPAPAETAHHGRSKSTLVARSGGDRSPQSLQVHSGGPLRRRPLATVAPSPLRWPAPAETARHGRSKSTPVACSGRDRSPRSPGVGSGEVVLAPWAVQGPSSRLAQFRTLSLHLRRPAESALVPEPGNKCYGLEGVRSTCSQHEHANAISIASR